MSSIQATVWAKHQHPGTSSQKLILMMLAIDCGSGYACYTTQQLLAESAELDIAQLQHDLHALEGSGYLTVHADHIALRVQDGPSARH